MIFGSLNVNSIKIYMKMEHKTLRLTILTLILIFSAQIVLSQKIHENPKYGLDSASRIECVKNLSLYREYVKQDNYKDAVAPWFKVFNSCPQATKNIYIDGVKILRYLIDEEVDPVKKNDLVDTLMKMYDRRIENYKQKGYVLGRKGVDYLRYRQNSIEDIEIGYKILEESIELRKAKSEEAVMVTFMTSTETLFKEAKIDREKVIENYAMLMDIIDAIIEAEKNNEKVLQARDNIDAIFERSGAATCEALIDLFKPKFEETPEDISLLEKITSLLDKTGCKDDELFFFSSEKLHNLKPTANSAAMIAEMAKKREEYDKSLKYYKEAVTLEENNEKKAIYYLQVADILRKLENFPESREYALKAVEANPSSGEPYILIGHLYAASKMCITNELEKGAIYWAAVDKYIKAKTVDPSLEEEANKYIVTYSGYFPTKETVFFFSLKNGDSYKLGCWINETTTVRTNE